MPLSSAGSGKAAGKGFGVYCALPQDASARAATAGRSDGRGRTPGRRASAKLAPVVAAVAEVGWGRWSLRRSRSSARSASRRSPRWPRSNTRSASWRRVIVAASEVAAAEVGELAPVIAVSVRRPRSASWRRWSPRRPRCRQAGAGARCDARGRAPGRRAGAGARRGGRGQASGRRWPRSSTRSASRHRRSQRRPAAAEVEHQVGELAPVISAARCELAGVNQVHEGGGGGVGRGELAGVNQVTREAAAMSAGGQISLASTRSARDVEFGDPVGASRAVGGRRPPGAPRDVSSRPGVHGRRFAVRTNPACLWRQPTAPAYGAPASMTLRKIE
jgi:hypothetical protein